MTRTLCSWRGGLPASGWGIQIGACRGIAGLAKVDAATFVIYDKLETIDAPLYWLSRVRGFNLTVCVIAVTAITVRDNSNWLLLWGWWRGQQALGSKATSNLNAFDLTARGY